MPRTDCGLADGVVKRAAEEKDIKDTKDTWGGMAATTLESLRHFSVE